MVDQREFKVRFWGVRGSYPTPGPHTVRYGGNTACVELQVGGHTIILDAGTGIIGLGQDLLQRTTEPLDLSVFFTHAHGDHLIGFPFFAPLFEKRARIAFFGPELVGQTLEQTIHPIMADPYFPVDLHDLPALLHFHTLQVGQTISWGMNEPQPQVFNDSGELSALDKDQPVVRACYTSCHPRNGSLSYRIEYAGRSFVFATDVEWEQECEEDFVEFAGGADVLVHDAQYTGEEYAIKRGYGHSSVEMATNVAKQAGAKCLILFHHNPGYDDPKLDQLQDLARSHFARTEVAFEGMEINLLA